jgi:hypothetical protein
MTEWWTSNASGRAHFFNSAASALPISICGTERHPTDPKWDPSKQSDRRCNRCLHRIAGKRTVCLTLKVP